MRDYSIIFCDVDGTLLDSGQNISEPTKVKIRALCDMGIPFVLASARKPQGIKSLHRQIGINAFAICYGGALLLDSKYCPVYSKGLSRERALAVKRAIRSSGCKVCASVYHDDLWIVDDTNDPWVAHERAGIEHPPKEGDMERVLNREDKVHKISCLGQPEEILRLEMILCKTFRGLNIVKSADNCLEISHCMVNKAHTALYLCEYLGISSSRAVAFGDYDNDLDLLLSVGLGVAMGNASPILRERVKNITEDNDHEGVLRRLEMLAFRPVAHCGQLIE